jgi:hypothetical protein
LSPSKVRSSLSHSDLDLLAASPDDGKIVWFERFEARDFGSVTTIGGQLQGVTFLKAADLHTDGELEISEN